MQFETRRIGKTALNVTTLGLGGATLAGNMADVTDAAARMLVIDAYDSGIRYFDTAPFYGYGRSEHLIGDELRNRDGWVLSTKVGRLLKHDPQPHDPNGQWRNPFPFKPVFDYSYDAIMRAFEDSLQRLAVSHIDIVYIHDIDVFSHGSKERQQQVFATAMDEAYRALDELRRAGHIKAIGLGVNEAGPIADAIEHGQWDVFLLAGRYTLLEQEPLHTLFPMVEKHGASIVIGGPFNSGVLVGRETWNYARAPQHVMDKVKRIAAVCDEHEVPLAAAALQFPLASKLVASVIPGPGSAEELNQITAWWNAPISAAFWRDLQSQDLLDKAAPVPN